MVLHARCTPKITHRRRSDRSGPVRDPTVSGRVPPSQGPPLRGRFWSFLAARSTTNRSADPLEREREAERRGRGPGSWGDSKPFDPTARCGSLRACIPVVCPSHQIIDSDNLHTSPRSPEDVPVYSAERISNRRYRLESASCRFSISPVTAGLPTLRAQQSQVNKGPYVPGRVG